MNRTKLLQVTLSLGGVYYTIGAIAHLFGLTIFPMYDGRLYTQYHDTIIALASVVLALMLFAIARNPQKNKTMLNIVVLGGIIAILTSLGILWKIDFVELGAPAKRMQTIVETILLVIFVVAVAVLKPKTGKRK